MEWLCRRPSMPISSRVEQRAGVDASKTTPSQVKERNATSSSQHHRQCRGEVHAPSSLTISIVLSLCPQLVKVREADVAFALVQAVLPAGPALLRTLGRRRVERVQAGATGRGDAGATGRHGARVEGGEGGGGVTGGAGVGFGVVRVLAVEGWWCYG